MKILHLSKDDIGGGAGKAAFRAGDAIRMATVPCRVDNFATEIIFSMDVWTVKESVEEILKMMHDTEE